MENKDEEEVSVNCRLNLIKSCQLETAKTAKYLILEAPAQQYLIFGTSTNAIIAINCSDRLGKVYQPLIKIHLCLDVYIFKFDA